MKHTTPIFFDKLGFTFHIPDSKKFLVQSNLYELSKEPYYKARFYKTWKVIDLARYGNHYIFRIPTDNAEGYFSIAIDIYPKKKSHNFIRFEFNPSKFGTSGEDELFDLFTAILGPRATGRIYNDARLTRLYLTINSHRRYNGSYMYMKNAHISKIIRCDDGEIQSQIIGSPNSDIIVTQYNKTLELAKKGISSKHKYWYRLEIKVNDLGFSISEIPTKLRNHFTKLSFYDKNFLDDEYFDEEFRINAYEEGINDAMHLMYKNTRKCYLRRLKHYKCDPFRLTKLSKNPGMKSLQFLR